MNEIEKKHIISIEAQQKFSALFEEDNEEQLQRMQALMESANGACMCNLHFRKPTLHVNLGQARKLSETPTNEVKKFFKEAENSLSFTGFKRQYKELESIEKSCRMMLKRLSVSTNVCLLTAKDFEDFYTYFKAKEQEWNNIVEEIRSIFHPAILNYKNAVGWRIRHDIAKDNESLRTLLIHRLEQSIPHSADAFCSKITIGLDTDFSPAQFNNQEIKDFLEEMQRNKVKEAMRNIVEGIILHAYNATCEYANALALTKEFTTDGFVKLKAKMRKAAEKIRISNVLEIDTINDISKRINACADEIETYSSMISIQNLILDIVYLANKYDVFVDYTKLPDSDTFRITI